MNLYRELEGNCVQNYIISLVLILLFKKNVEVSMNQFWGIYADILFRTGVGWMKFLRRGLKLPLSSQSVT